MHTKPMSDSEGTFQDEWKLAVVVGDDGLEKPWPCRKCGEGQVYYRDWESSDGAYDDTQYECRNPKCGRKWWVEGADA